MPHNAAVEWWRDVGARSDGQHRGMLDSQRRKGSLGHHRVNPAVNAMQAPALERALDPAAAHAHGY
jgi:hypothetical protein